MILWQVQDFHLCSGTSSTPTVWNGHCPYLLQWQEYPLQAAYSALLVLAGGIWDCSVAYSMKEGFKKCQTTRKYPQNTLRNRRFSSLRPVHGGTEGKVLDLAVSIQELCSHRCFHFRMSGVQDHTLYSPQPWTGAFGLCGIQKKPKENNFLEEEREKTKKAVCHPQGSTVLITGQKI